MNSYKRKLIPEEDIKLGEHLSQLIHQLAASLAAMIGDKTKYIPHITPIPDNGFTSGANNTFWAPSYGEELSFGTTCNTLARGSFRVPKDYKSGTDIKLRFMMKAGGGSVTVNSSLYAACKGDNQVHTWEINNRTTALSPTSINAANTWEDATFTIANADCSFVAGQYVYFAVRIVDNAGVRTLRSSGWSVEYTSKEVD